MNIKNVLEYLEQAAATAPDKSAVTEGDDGISYHELLVSSRRVGTALAAQGVGAGQPVAVLMEKGIAALQAFFGAVYAGGFYVLLNPELPQARLRQILTTLQPRCLVTDEAHEALAVRLTGECSDPPAVLRLLELCMLPPDDEVLDRVRRAMIDTDPLYANFTSGSTGVPKGVLIAHRSVIDFMEQFVPLFHMDASDVVANQAPFDFDVSVKDIYSSLKACATLVILPKTLFSRPAQLLDALCEQHVTTLIWAVSALCLITTFHGLDYRVPAEVRRVLFSGEVMPQKHLNQWMERLPQAEFVNLYGPTEITCNCTYHRVERGRNYEDGLPIGRPFDNERVFLLDEHDEPVNEPERVGEICVTGTALALGYYADPAATARGFVTDPRGCGRVYRTGDLGRYNAHGELMFAGRRDFQIKYMGHRIELEGIENAMMQESGVARACCLFDEEKNRLYGFYVGEAEPVQLHRSLSERLPVYMVPRNLKELKALPMTKNGKTDRKALMALCGKHHEKGDNGHGEHG